MNNPTTVKVGEPVSDNGSQMIATGTRRFMALVAIAQHFGRPSTPTDQAWIESLNGTLKAAWPDLGIQLRVVENLNVSRRHGCTR